VIDVSETIGQNLTRETVIVTKSTVPVGTADKVRTAVGKHAKFPFHVVSNPSFSRRAPRSTTSSSPTASCLASTVILPAP